MIPVFRHTVPFAIVIMLFPFLYTGMTLFAQEIVKDTGNIRLIQDDKVHQLVRKHIQINQNRQGFDGYRIQIFFDSGTNSKIRAKSVYENFLAKYTYVNAYLTFKAPNYKVRVGDFRQT